MEATLYGDQGYDTMDDIDKIKKRMTLDLNSRPPKKPRVDLLSSPDMDMLKLRSPELERLIITNSGQGFVTPTPGGGIANYLFGKTEVTAEQENFSRGFVDALDHLKQQQEGPGAAVPEAYEAPVYTTLESTRASAVTTLTQSQLQLDPYIQIKEEPQTVPSNDPMDSQSPGPLSPVDMEEQEKIKIERKRMRNRQAATKCRRRKLDRIAKLEDKVGLLKKENSELAQVANKLRDQVMALKSEVLGHSQNGCQIMYSSC